jgi:hypothetical protein
MFAAAPLWAADPDNSNTLTPKEIADGWILLFDGESTFGWNNGAKWTIARGMIAPQAENKLPLVTTTAFGDFELKAQYLMKSDSKPQILLGCGPDGSTSDKSHTINLTSYRSESWFEITVSVTDKGITHSLREAGRRFTFQPPQKAVERKFERCHIGLTGNGVIFRNIQLKPLGGKPLFNGKDLVGWKKFEADPKRAKSSFTVTKEGWLNLKNGPGDLQTEAEWADFVLQLDCISNGKHLNSGVFFRCRPGEYQQGYEAQIHNGFTQEP